MLPLARYVALSQICCPEPDRQAQYAALFEKVVACVCVCECELDAAGAALSQIDKHNMRHYSMPSKRLVAEMRADGRDVSLHRNAS